LPKLDCGQQNNRDRERGTILVLEYWCNDDDSAWSQDNDSLIALGSNELRQTGLIKNCTDFSRARSSDSPLLSGL